MILLIGALFYPSQQLPNFLLGQICHFIHLGTRLPPCETIFTIFSPTNNIQHVKQLQAGGLLSVLFIAAEERKKNTQKKKSLLIYLTGAGQNNF